MLQTLHEYVYFWINLVGFIIIFSLVPCILWVVVSHYYVYRRGGIDGLVRWHQNNIRKYGFNDVVNSLSILGLSLLSLLFTIPTPSPSDLLATFSTFLSAILFVMVAAFVGDRRKHWSMLKVSAREVILEYLPPNIR